MSLHTLANHLQSAGRGEDKVLVHMTPKEVQGLQSLAMAHGGSLTINPETGLAEAGFLSSMLPMIAGAALAATGVGAPMAAMMVGGAGALATGSLSKGLMMGLGAYGGAGLGAGLSAAGAGAAGAAGLSAIPQATAAPMAAAGTPLSNAIQSAQAVNVSAPAMSMASNAPNVATALGAPTNMMTPANIMATATPEITGQSIFDKFSQAGRGLGNVFGGGPEGERAREQFTGQISKPQMYSAGISAMMAAQQEQQDKMEREARAANRPTGPFKPKYEFDSGYNAAATSPSMTGERTYFSPSYNPVRAAGGGMMASPTQGGAPVEQMSNLNAIGANTRYPMANQTTSEYATAAQRPISENVLTPMTNYNLDPYSGEQKFASGGIANLANGGPSSLGTIYSGNPNAAPSKASAVATKQTQTAAAGTPTMTFADAVKQLKSEGVAYGGQKGSELKTSQDIANYLGVNIKTSGGTIKNAVGAGTTPVSTGAATSEKATKYISVPDFSSKEIRSYSQPTNLEDLFRRETGIENLTVQQKKDIRNVSSRVTNQGIESLINKYAPAGGAKYLGLSTLPTDIGGKGTEPIFGEPPKGQSPIEGYTYDPKTKTYKPKSEDSNIYLSNKAQDITTVSQLDPVTIALYGRKATLGDLQNYKTKDLGFKLSLADIYTDMSSSKGYQDFLGGQKTSYLQEYAAKPAEVSQIYRDIFGKAAPADVSAKYKNMTPDQVRQAILASDEYAEYLNKGIKPDIEYDAQGNVVIPGAITRKTDTAGTGYTYSGPPITAAAFEPFTPTYAGGKSGLEAIIPQTSSVTPSVGSAFTPNYAQSPIQNALAPAFTPSSVFSLPSVSTQAIPNQPLVSTGTLPLATNAYQSPMNAISAFNPFTNLTPDQLKNLTPEQYQQYMNLMQAPVGSSVFSAGTYNPFPSTTLAGGAASPTKMAMGGVAQGGYNLGGYSDGGRLLKGPGDGVSDSIPASIGDRQPARLADGEFVVPARIVSEIGNGSTDAGARKLYAMMDRVQRARRKTVGKGKVAVNSKADKLLPV